MTTCGPEDRRAAGRTAAVPWSLVLALFPVALGLLVSGCGTSSPATHGAGRYAGAKVTVMTGVLPGVGTVLVDARGYVLYMFMPDKRRRVTCTGQCAQDWPPLTLPAGTVSAADPGVTASLLGSDPGPGGGRVVTYHGWPLYTYGNDTRPGQATGQAVTDDGGAWYLLRPSGAPLIPAPQA